MALGTPTEVTAAHIRRIEDLGREMQKVHMDEETGRNVIMNVISIVGGQGMSGGRGQAQKGRSHIGEVAMQIIPPDERTSTVTSLDLAKEWRQKIGMIPGAQDLNFRAEIGRASSPVDIQLTGPDFDQLSALGRKFGDVF